MSMQGRKRKLAVLLSASMLSSTVFGCWERASLKFMLPRKKQKTILRRGLEQE